MDDDALIARLAAGDEAALREHYFRHAPMLVTRLRAVLPAVDVEDVLQETFIAAWRGARRYRAEAAAAHGTAGARVTVDLARTPSQEKSTLGATFCLNATPTRTF